MSKPNEKRPTTGIQSKPKKVSLKEVGTRSGNITRFGKLLKENLGDHIFQYSKSELLYHTLIQIKEIYRWLAFTPDSLTKALDMVCSSFGVKKLSDRPNEEFKTTEDVFFKFVLGLSKPPSLIFESLTQKADQDLFEITELIGRYEKESEFIRSYIISEEQPRNHKDRFHLDFYKRCLDERNIILKFRLYDIKKRSLELSTYMGGLDKVIPYYYHERQYLWAFPSFRPFFDVEKLDLVHHRVSEFPINEANRLAAIYKVDKVKFYRAYFKKITPQQHFVEIRFHASHVPMKVQRKAIFDELENLFRRRLWIGFYALAMPQIEGLFAEMLETVLPKKAKLTGALPDKVNSVRPFYSLSQSYFDYYQYHIPILRNKFAHTGYDDDFKAKSFDLLSDLRHILSVYFELDHPFVKLKRIIVRRNPDDFISVKEISDYIKLIENSEEKQLDTIRNDIDEFEREFISKYCEINFTLQEMCRLLPNKLDSVLSQIQNNFDHHNIEFDFLESKQSEFSAQLTYANSQGFFLFFIDELEYFSFCNIILDNFQRCFPSIDEEIKDLLKSIKNSNKKKLFRLKQVWESMDGSK